MYLNPSENVYKHGLVVNKLIDYFTEKKKSCMGDFCIQRYTMVLNITPIPFTPAKCIGDMLYTFIKNQSTEVLIMLNK